jgi:hypothetical protein
MAGLPLRRPDKPAGLSGTLPENRWVVLPVPIVRLEWFAANNDYRRD